jgi:sec-independent protein translocase protein TatA
MGPLGWQETAFIFVLALLIFGPKKLPELGKTIGKAMTEFRRASSELKGTFDREMYALERETESLKQDVQKASGLDSTYDNSSYNYDSYNYDSGSYDSGAYDASLEASNGASTATETDTPGASATQGAESTTVSADATAAEPSSDGTVARGSVSESPAPAESKPVAS